MRDLLHGLRENLLRAGVSPRHVERYLRELTEHRDDIAEHLRRTGLSPDVAQVQAEHRLGGRDALLLPMLADLRFRSPAARWPALFYLVLPLALQAALVIVGVLTLLLAANTELRPAITDLGSGMALVLLISPILIAWLTLLAARRRRASLRWPVLGAFIGAALASALQLGVTLPASDAAGRISLTLGIPPLLPVLLLVLLSLLPLTLQPLSD